MFKLKSLSKEAIPSALERAERYRLLNEPNPAESICLDILEIEPDNQKALVTLILAMSDSFAEDYSAGDRGIKSFVERIKDEYERTYYTGIVYERRAKAILTSGPVGSETAAFDFLRQAMDWFEKAEEIRPSGNDDAILRWNSCARLIITNNLSRREVGADFLE